MSKIIYVCFKDASRCNPGLQKKLMKIGARITPDNITPRPTNIVMSGNVIYGITNPTDSLLGNGRSVLMGMPFGEHERWWEPGRKVPDGSFAIFRSDDETTEVLTDVVASRTIWYYHDDEVFIASSSQRAIVMMLGSFNLNQQVIPWVMSTGSLGPSHSWDRRIKILPPDSLGSLNHKTWVLTVRTTPVEFIPDSIVDNEHENRLRSALTDTFRSLKIDFSKWVLPLSGGYDSRGILSLFKHIGVSLNNLRGVTWGLKTALNQSDTDAYIAKKVASHFQIQHTYYNTDIADEPIETIFSRFLVCGEGRIDHISGYMDGFKIWQTLHNENVEGIMRGDVSFSSKESESEYNIRKLQGITLCSDFKNLNNYESMGFSLQKFPEFLQRNEEENLEMWRDRLYHQFRIPIILSALNDLKLPYVEVINPFLSRKIVYQTRSMPDSLRSNKIIFKKILDSISPDLEYATSGANANVRYFLKSKQAVDLFKAELKSDDCRQVISREFAEYCLEKLVVTEDYVHKKPSLKMLVLRYVPRWLTKKASGLTGSSNLDINVLAFRTYVISKMNRMLEEDAAIIAQK